LLTTFPSQPPNLFADELHPLAMLGEFAGVGYARASLAQSVCERLALGATRMGHDQCDVWLGCGGVAQQGRGQLLAGVLTVVDHHDSLTTEQSWADRTHQFAHGHLARLELLDHGVRICR